MTQPRDLLGFIDYARGQCAYAGVTLKFFARPTLRGRETSGSIGYFHDRKRVLYVATENAEWACVAAHELGHMQQWMENSSLYDPEDCSLTFDGWLDKTRRLKPAQLHEVTRRVQRMELDAERRALRLIKRFHLTSDLTGYIQDANLYVWCYEVARRLKAWPPRTFELQRKMPVHLISQRQLGKPPAFIEESVQ